MSDIPVLPAHIEQTIETITELHRQHQRRATPSQKVVAQLTAAASQPRFVGLMTVVFALWIGLNGVAKLAGYAPPDPPPFSYIQAVSGIASVYVALLVLITQRRENQLSEARDQLTLELAIVNEQKSAKIIALLEEMRRDLPSLPDRSDPEAEQLSTPANPQAVLDALHDATEKLLDSLPAAEPGPTPPQGDGQDERATP